MTRKTLVLLAIACCFAAPAVAEVDINELIADAGLREGPVAMRDMEGWRSPRKIVIVDRFEEPGEDGVLRIACSILETVREEHRAFLREREEARQQREGGGDGVGPAGDVPEA